LPTIATFHVHYWENTGGVTPPAPVATAGGYHQWQRGVILGSMFGGLTPWMERLEARIARWWDRTRWIGKTVYRVSRLHGEHRDVFLRVLTALEDPDYLLAQRAVRKTATTLGFNRPGSWKQLGDALKKSPGNAENTFRHLNALHLLQENAIDRTLQNPESHLLIELAYQGFSAAERHRCRP
jgi:hypothetical protein